MARIAPAQCRAKRTATRLGRPARTAPISAGTSGSFRTRAGSFDTGRIKPGKSVTVRFAQTGTFAYHCTIHSFMHGKVVVH